MEKLDIFINRMKKINIDMKLGGNFPWIYIDYINGKRIIEKFQGNHGFTIGFYPIRQNQKFEFTNISEIFKLIRKYQN